VISPNLGAAVSVAVVELILVAVAGGALLVLVTLLSRRAWAARGGVVGALGNLATVKVRALVIRISLLAALLIVGYNGWLVSRGLDARTDAISLLRSITLDHARLFVIRLAQLALIGIGVLMGTRLVRSILRAVEPILGRWDRLVDEHRTLRKVFAGLDRAVLSTAYLLGAVFACQLLSFPASIVNGLMALMRIWAVVAFGIPIIQSTAVIVATSAGLGRTVAHQHGLGRHFDQLHALLPTFRVCLDYALWVLLVTLALGQVAWLGKVSSWGPILIEGIAIFFVGQVIIQLGYLEIAHRMLPHEGLQESERRRRATMVPLVRSAFMYAAYFATAVLILSAMGFNPMPFLAGAGILGLVVGFGAQSMINDVVSGFFILFENIYLVGDVIEVGSACGVVEAIEFRTTKIRDADGRLHIVRNGDMKLVVNYSKDYAVAAVALDVGYDANLRAVFASLHDAGEQLRAENPEILGETEINGITAFGPSTMTIRTSTRVKPGCHQAIAAKLRLAFKETFDPKTSGTLRKTLIPESWAPAGHTPFMIHGEEPSTRMYR
jgi:small-conductance mechanosensitive channel